MPRYRQRLAFVPLGQGRPALGRRPALQPALPHPPHRAARARHRRGAQAPRRARLRPAAGPRQAAVGDLARRGPRAATASRSSPRPTTRWSTASAASTSSRSCSTPRPTRRRRPSRRAPWLPRPLPTRRRAARRGAARARDACPPRRCAALRALTRAAAQVADAAPSAPPGSARWPGAGLSPRPALAAQRRRSARTGATRGSTPTSPTFKAIKTALGGTVNDVVLTAVARALGRWLRGRGEDTDGLELRAMVPVSVRADDRARRAGQPRGGDVGAAAGRRRATRATRFAEVHEAMGDLKESGQAVGAEALTQLAGFAAADDHEPGRAAAGAPALLQPRRHQRARARSSPLYLLGPPAARPYPRRAAGAKTRRSGIAIMSYDGRLGFGLLGDFDALPDLEDARRRPRAARSTTSRAAAGADAARGRAAQATARRAARAPDRAGGAALRRGRALVGAGRWSIAVGRSVIALIRVLRQRATTRRRPRARATGPPADAATPRLRPIRARAARTARRRSSTEPRPRARTSLRSCAPGRATTRAAATDDAADALRAASTWPARRSMIVLARRSRRARASSRWPGDRALRAATRGRRIPAFAEP